jgi:phage tail sheath protein FI
MSATSTTTLAKNRKTPGVYVTEFPAFPPSIVGVETAVPIFVGYTEKASDPSSGKQLYLQAIPLSSMADYTSYFGYGFDAQGIVEAATDNNYDFNAPSATAAPATPPVPNTVTNYVVGTSSTLAGVVTFAPQFNLFSAMQLFFANGGGNCFVISVNNYWNNSTTVPPAVTSVSKDDLLNGLAVANVTSGGTMLVVPDACLLVTPTTTTTTVAVVPATDPPTTTDVTTTTYTYPDYQPVVVEMLRQAAALQDRVAILDLPGALVPANWTVTGMAAEADAFYTAIAPAAANFSYGAAYGPALETSLLATSDVLYSNLSGTAASIATMNNLLTTQALSLYPPVADPTTQALTYSPTFINVCARIAAAYDASAASPASAGTPPNITGLANGVLVSMLNTSVYAVPITAADQLALDQYLINAVPLLGQIQQILAGKLNVVPPSGVMAGIWTLNDLNRGVWNAPANMALNEVIAPKVVLSDAQQGDYNVPLNGNAIDILRAMVNRGTVVWGARTLDGNSLDYRYIQVRRTLIYIEQSIKTALQQFVFAANDGGTWATVTATISNFLTQFWQAGGLMGDKASDAFTVNCGVPTTMSGLDVLNGYMIVNVTVQLIHPAEFIELTFTQTMQGV